MKGLPGEMTIIVEGQPLTRLPDSVHKLFDNFPILKKEAVKFASQSVQNIDQCDGNNGVLYVTQKEYVNNEM